MPTFVLPMDPPASASETEKRIWEKKCVSSAKHKEALEQNLQQLFALVMGQYTENMRLQLLGLSTFDDIDKNLDGLKLLNVVTGIVYQFQSHKYIPHAIHEPARQFYMLQLGKYNTAAV